MKTRDYVYVVLGTLAVLFLLSILSSFIAGFNEGVKDNTKEIVDNANRLQKEYNQKIDAVNDIQNRVNAMGKSATKEMYIEWKQIIDEALTSGEKTASYINNNLNVLEPKSASAFLTIIAGNKVKFESQNRVLEKVINDWDKTNGAVSNANRLRDEYNDKLNLVTEIQKRVDALGSSATKSMYVEWRYRNNAAIDAGERLATYLNENFNVFEAKITSDLLSTIAKNKERLERDNQNLEQIINVR